MAKLKLVYWVITICCLALLSNSCAKIPVEFILEREVGLTEKELQDITEQVKGKLAKIDFSHPPGSSPGMINPELCRDAYKNWLDKQFLRGVVPKKVITAADYTESLTNPLKHQCRKIDFEKEYKISTKDILRKHKKQFMLFNMESTREKILKNKCLKAFIDPEKQKMELSSLLLKITENKLNIPSPGYRVYSSHQPLENEDLVKKSEATLLADGVFMRLADSGRIPIRYIGTLPIPKVENKETYKKAVLPLLSLTGSVVAYPNFETFRPQITTISGEPYYVVPKGSLKASIRLVFNFTASLKDAICTYDEFIEKVKKISGS